MAPGAERGAVGRRGTTLCVYTESIIPSHSALEACNISQSRHSSRQATPFIVGAIASYGC